MPLGPCALPGRRLMASRRLWIPGALLARELKRYDDALATLEQARTANAPEAMIDFERARNLALRHRDDDALAALDASHHNGLRALELVERAHEFDAFRAGSRFQRVYRNVRARVYPCEGMEAS